MNIRCLSGPIPRIKARKIAQIFGGYGFTGQIRSLTRTTLAVSAGLSIFIGFYPEAIQSQSNGAKFLFWAIALCALVLITVELIVKPYAQSLHITPELQALAQQGDRDAAFTLAELYAADGADAHAAIWISKAADLGHSTARKIRRTQ